MPRKLILDVHAPGPPNADVAFDADARRFVEIMLETFS